MSINVRSAGLAMGVALAAAATAIAGTVGAGAAHAAPVAVQQVPANGILSTGLGAWSGYAAWIVVATDGPGRVKLSAPGGSACQRGAAGTLVRFDYTNVSTGRTGSATVRPCRGPFSGPLQVTLRTGAGQIVGATSIINSSSWQVPGGATFTVR